MDTKEAISKQDFSQLPEYKIVLDYVREHPGVQARAISDATDTELPTIRRRLLRLQAEHIVRTERYPRALLFYAEGQ